MEHVQFFIESWETRNRCSIQQRSFAKDLLRILQNCSIIHITLSLISSRHAMIHSGFLESFARCILYMYLFASNLPSVYCFTRIVRRHFVYHQYANTAGISRWYLLDVSIIHDALKASVISIMTISRYITIWCKMTFLLSTLEVIRFFSESLKF